VSAGWVAGSVRAQALARRRLGTAGVRALAQSASLAEAVETLAASPYGRHVSIGANLAQAQHGVAEALLWNLRVLAGWLPATGARTLRLLAGWFEIANVDEHLQQLAGRAGEQPYRLGVLAAAWPRLATTTSAQELREALAGSVWGDPGGHTAREIGLSMRVAWAQRIAAQVDSATPWALGATALLVAAEEHVARRRLPERAARGVETLLGRGWVDAANLTALRDSLPADARWALRDVEHPQQLWRAEAGWWARLRTDGLALLAGSGFTVHRPLGAAVLLAADAWQVRAALEIAARPEAPKVIFDVVA
jgi:hypothetical protein